MPVNCVENFLIRLTCNATINTVLKLFILY